MLISGRPILGIADIPIAIESDARLPEWKVPPAYRPFIAAGKQDLVLGLHSGIPATPDGKKVFDSSPIWTLYHCSHAAVFKIFDNFGTLKQRLLIPPDCKRADLYFDKECDHVMGPFAGPAMELMIINYLAGASGIILHACGIEYRGKGYLFAGESGAGKSTLSGLWDRDNGVQVLSDDRTIVRKQGRTLRMYGTPWHGDMPIGSPRGTQLAGIFFLGHGGKNAVRELKGSSAMLGLLKCSFPPFWDAPGMEAAMELLEELATRVSCCELSFKPDRSAVGFLKGII